MKQNFLKAKTGTIRLTVYQDNVSIIPTSAYVTLYTPDGAELQAEASADINADTGEMTYDLTAVHTANNKVNHKAEWRYVYNSTTYYEAQLFDVVKYILAIPIVDEDLYKELESLRKQNAIEQGTADSATTTTIVDTERKEEDNYWKGGILKVISGTGSGQERSITSFAQTTSTLTVSPAFATTPDDTSIYTVIRSYTEKIEQAFDELDTAIYNMGNRANLILESSQIKHPLMFLTIQKIARDLSSEELDKWDRISVDYKEKYDVAFSNMKLDYDADESGSIVGEEAQRKLNSVRLLRS